ncbi:2-oxo-3-hexenedioate decarboxylase [Cupriavidus numazuensis]|uniref:2-hydroxyhexa-2,4-dienoate hydratase n=1 Tax=Cupriavidus numazuensis TaxID=221992 RepID=A0ABM8TBU6_9BURK|nr:2-oxo-3-hexenedioate decarboxylase [Cupriavidus numazuensis]CAG2134412.1 2-hydroxyhexa-2,4-dienoate hydratase [Cupriavidus numazuensis]
MKLDNNTILALAEYLETAELQARDVTKITDDHPDMDWDDAYAIQDEIRRRKVARGNKIVGLKAGLTSFAKMKQMGVTSPVFGFVADYMSCPDGSEIRTGELIHPKVEAEICVVTKAPLKGPGCHIAAVMAAVDFVVPAVEVIDSRYRDFKFDLKSVIADNTSASRFVIGGRMRSLEDLDLRTLGVVLEKNGEVVTMAAGAAVLGNPLVAVAMLANHLGARGQEIPAGSFIMTGGVTEAIAVEAGDSVAVRFQDLGTVSMRFA